MSVMYMSPDNDKKQNKKKLEFVWKFIQMALINSKIKYK